MQSPTLDRVYLNPIRSESARMLGLMDREPLSPTRGCMDRTYWAWKFTDFPGARFQEGLCALAFLYSTSSGDNDFHGQPRLLEWIEAGFDYWCSIQYRGGHFDEAYPFEHSLAATAFTAFYLSEAWLMLEGRLAPSTSERFRAALRRAADWLERNDETHGFLTNHLAAAAAALWHAARITGESRFEKRGRYFLQKILDHQSEEGWYEEYGGADPGYQSHGTFYLARCLELSGDEGLAESLERSLSFLACFVHPDGSLGGEYASRNTQFYYPAAFEMLSARSGRARWIAETMQGSVPSLAAAGAGSMDAYNYFPLLNNYVFAHRACLEPGHRSAPLQPPRDEPLVHFPEAGMLRRRTDSYDLFVGLRKGGVIKAFDRATGKLVCSDCGYLGRLQSGKLFSSQADMPDRSSDVSLEEIRVAGSFHAFSRPVMKTWPFVAFRLFSMTVGRWARVGYWLKSLLVRVLIYRRKGVDLGFVRRILTDDSGFTVRDELRGEATGVASLQQFDRFTTVHMGSSKYFIPNELSHEAPASEPVDTARLRHGVTVERRIDVRSAG